MNKYARDHKLNINRESFESQLNLLGKESHGVVRKVGESGGGLYVIRKFALNAWMGDP